MKRRAALSSSPGVPREASARSCSHSAASVTRSASMRSCRRLLVPWYTARKLSPTASAVMRVIALASCARSPPGESRLATGDAQPIADVAHRLDHFAPVVAVADRELAAQVADVDLEHLGARIEVEAPYGVEELLPGEHLIGMADQVCEQLELAGGQRERVGVAFDPTSAQVEADVAGLEHRRRALRRHPQLRPDAGEQLLQRERLGDVVVRTAVEPLDLLLDRAASGQQNDRELWVARPDGVQDLQPVLTRQQHVEQHEPVVPGERLELGAPTVVDDADGVASACRLCSMKPARERSSSTIRMRISQPC